MPHETIANVEVLGGKRWSEAVLEELADATDDVPVTVDGEAAGVLSNVRRAGGSLFADLRRVPARLAEALRTRVQRIGTSVYHDPARGLRAVRTEAGAQQSERGGPGGVRPLAPCTPAAVSPRAGTGGPEWCFPPRDSCRTGLRGRCRSRSGAARPRQY